MWTSIDRQQKFSGRRSPRLAAIALGFVLGVGAGVLPGLSGTAHAAPFPQSADRPPANAPERAELRQAIESRFEVLPVTGGVLLKPRLPKASIHSIELTGPQIAVNGEAVSARTLRDWLGEDAEPVIRLQGLTAASQRQLFGLSGEVAAKPPKGAAPEATTAPEDTEEPATTDSETDVAETSGDDVSAAPEAPEPPHAHRSRHSDNSRINVGGSVTIRKDEVVDDAVAVGGSVEVLGEVTGDVSAIGGPVRIEGTVGGEVLSVGGSVYLGPHAVVQGDVTSVGGAIQQDPGAVIHGSKAEVGMVPFLRHHRGFHVGPMWNHWGFWGGVSDLMGSLMGLILSGLLVCLVMLLAGRPVERVDRQIVAQPWRSAAVGLAGSIFFWPLLIVVTVLLAITIVGCVLFLLYPFLLLYVGLLLLLGYTAAAYRVGRLVEGRFNLSLGSPYAAALVGVVSLQIWHVLGNLFDLLPGPFGLLSFIFSLFGALLTMAAVIVGFGAVILARLGLEPGYWPPKGGPYRSAAPVEPAPPTPPTAPVDPLPLSQPRWEEPRAPEDPESPR